MCFGAASRVSAQAPADPSAIVQNQHEVSSNLASSWLASSDPRTVAWGAYVALRDHRAELIPQLIELTRQYDVGARSYVPTDGHRAMLAILDALVQFGVKTQARDAARLFPEFPLHSILLLSHASDDATSSLLDIFETKSEEPIVWLAVGNLLYERDNPEFVADVWSGLTIHVSLRVHMPNSEGRLGLGTGVSCGSFIVEKEKEIWPKIGTYGASVTVADGEVVLARGPDPVYYGRVVLEFYDPRISSFPCGPIFDLDLLRQRYLAGLLDFSQEKPPIRAYMGEEIIWTNDAKYLDEVKAIVETKESELESTAKRLRKCDLLPKSTDGARQPKIDITIGDQREKSASPLSAPTDLPPNVHVRISQ